MKRTILLIAVSLITSLNALAHKSCACEKARQKISSDLEEIDLARFANWGFTGSFESKSGRGVVGAAYYYCDEEHGILVVNRHDRNIIYKNVPLKIWFEFRFAGSVEHYYRQHIKYNYIAIQIDSVSPNLGDTKMSLNVH